jgi:outer membrane lipoprotein-sorting protein
MDRIRIGSLVLALLACVTATSAALAQDLDAQTVLDNIQATFEELDDVTFLLTGAIVDPDGTEIALEIEVAVIPDARVASAYIIQPDALADNIIVWNDQAVYNYIYLTNQVTIFDADDPDALGGIFGEDLAENEEFEVTLDLGEVFDGFEASIEDYLETPAGPAYLMRFVNVQEDAEIATATAQILDGRWLPYSVSLFGRTGARLATLVFENVETDVGLAPEAVTYVPEDAEVIDERE